MPRRWAKWSAREPRSISSTDAECGHSRMERGDPRRRRMPGATLLRSIVTALFLVAAFAAALAPGKAQAQAQDKPQDKPQDKLRIAAGLAGTWENSFSELGQNAGFFKKHGLALEIFYTQGAGETQQAVISGSADIGTGVGAFNTFGAFAKGAPIRVIGATHTGANDLTWYVRADSSIKSPKDFAGKTVAYSTT